MIDLFFRAETPLTMRTVLTSAKFREIVGDITDSRETLDDGSPNPGRGELALRQGRYLHIPGAVDAVWFPPGNVVILPGDEVTPPTTDPWPWLHLRLSGPAETRDHRDGPGADRWNKSRIIDWLRANGTTVTLAADPRWAVRPEAANVRAILLTLPNGERFGVVRGRDMAATGLVFHEFLGGNNP